MRGGIDFVKWSHEVITEEEYWRFEKTSESFQNEEKKKENLESKNTLCKAETHAKAKCIWERVWSVVGLLRRIKLTEGSLHN